MAIQLQHRLFTTDEYHTMLRTGVLIEVYTNPAPAGYRSIRRALPGESLSPAALPDIVFEIDEILK